MLVVRRSAAVALLALAGLAASGTARELDETSLKAAFLVNFAKYVEWPDGAFESTNESLVICVVQDRAVYEALSEHTEGAALDDLPIRIRRVHEASEAAHCQILYVGDADEPRLPAIRRAIAARPVLTVGDEVEFLRRGGMIALVREDGRLRFEIDNGHVERAGLKLSSQLLKLARRVIGLAHRGNRS